jgi:hypothetical protein
MKKNLLTSWAVISCALFTASHANSADWSDSSIGVRHGTHYSEAGVGRGITKTIYNFTHVDGDAYGVNFFTVDVLESDSGDPAANSHDGAQEVYGLYQRTIPLSVFGWDPKSYDVFNKASLLFRVDLGSKNTAFAPRPRKYRLGLNFPLPIEKGLWDLSFSAYKESNHNGIVGRDVNYDTTWSLGSVWSIPAGPGNFGGFLNVTGPKGKDGFNNDTKTEVLLRVSYLFDIGKTGLKAGLAYEHWRNMYGCDEALDDTGGSRGNTPMLITEYHF